jgi:glycosyltransferase involved in cell wall biosynthesis
MMQRVNPLAGAVLNAAPGAHASPLAKSLGILRRAWRMWRELGLRVFLRKVARRFRTGKRLTPVLTEELRVVVDNLPNRWHVGKGNVLFLSGACYHPASRVKSLEIRVNGFPHPVNVATICRGDVFERDFPHSDPHGFSRNCGFHALLPVSPCPDRPTVHLAIQERLQNGAVCLRSLGDVCLDPVPNAPAMVLRTIQGRPIIAICMTTYNPAIELFHKQIESIKSQTNRAWFCLISDDGSRPEVVKQMTRVIGSDPRFIMRQNPVRLGFYRNFEKCMSMVPKDADFVALSDHDDSWHPEKLDALLAEFDPNTTLVYSDMNVVDREGKPIASTYWTNRRNNYTSLSSLLLANTITGAAAMFPRSLLEYLLPFPDPIGDQFHDHWIGCTALALGRIKYIDRPLYDYVQHANNVIGHYVVPRKPGLKLLTQLAKAVMPVRVRSRLIHVRDHIRSIYVGDVLRVEQTAQVLQLRCAGNLDEDKNFALRRVASIDSSLKTILWLLFRSLVGLRPKTVTMGAESRLLKGVAWHWCMGTIAWVRSWRQYQWHPVQFRTATTPSSGPGARLDILRTGLDRVEAIEQKIAPLTIRANATAPPRVNLLIPTIDFNYVFGGYITKFNLARRLADDGYRVRIVTVDYCDYQPDQWRRQLRSYPRLENLLDKVEVVCAFNRSKPLEANPRDAFIATTWWTAHIAHDAVKQLGQSRFVYLIQEYEPFTFPMGSYAALADESYGFDHYGMFSTDLLRDYFREHRLGVFAGDPGSGDDRSIVFQNTITDVGSISLQDIAGRQPKKLLFYARPEIHAARNMFELGLTALERVVKAGHFDKDWEFFGIGTVETSGRIPLGNGTWMQLLPRQTQETYREVLRGHDLGLGLMYTPHPSLVPIEMASAGMRTVTNTWGVKTGPRLVGISTNLIPVPPTLVGVQQGLKLALQQIDDYEGRVCGAKVQWSTTWEQAFHAAIMNRLRHFLEACGRGPAEKRTSAAA